MLKRVLMMVLILAVAVSVSGPAFGRITMKWCKGKVTAHDASKNSLTVEKEKGKTMTFDCAGCSCIREQKGKNEDVNCSEVKAGMTVRVHYYTKDNVLRAEKITIKDKG